MSDTTTATKITHWRDLQDQLTPDQVRYMVREERIQDARSPESKYYQQDTWEMIHDAITQTAIDFVAGKDPDLNGAWALHDRFVYVLTERNTVQLRIQFEGTSSDAWRERIGVPETWMTADQAEALAAKLTEAAESLRAEEKRRRGIFEREYDTDSVGDTVPRMACECTCTATSAQEDCLRHAGNPFDRIAIGGDQ